MRRLLLIRHATTAAVRRAAFPVDEPLDDAGRAAAATLAGSLGRGEALCSPALRARQTAAAAGLAPVELEAQLRECDFGAWAGRVLADVHADDPDGAAAWMTDPDAAPHGGEPLSALLARVGRWLDEQARRDGRAVHLVAQADTIAQRVLQVCGLPYTHEVPAPSETSRSPGSA